LINDAGESEIPLIRAKNTVTLLEVHSLKNSRRTKFQSDLLVDFWNTLNMTWEPMIEPLCL